MDTIIPNFKGATKQSIEITFTEDRKEVGNLWKEFGFLEGKDQVG